MDVTHLLVNIDTTTLAVLDTSAGSAVNLTLANADKVEMTRADPGGV